MKVIVHYRNDPERGLTDPVPEPGGRRFIFRLYSGNWLDPVQITLFKKGGWFEPPFAKRVINRFIKWPVLPFVSWKWPFLNRAGYIGFKLYGVDHAVYEQSLQIPKEEIYEGSQAVCFSVRPAASIK